MAKLTNTVASSAIAQTTRSCDREPLHIPGQIQGHGLMLVANASDWRVSRMGGAVRRLLGMPPEDILGTRLLDAFDPGARKDLEELLAGAGDRPRDVALLSCRRGLHQTLSATAFKVGDDIILEIEPSSLGLSHNVSWLQVCCCDLLEGMASLSDLEDLYRIITQTIRFIAGFDRVMLYQFHKDFSGEVVAEEKIDNLLPFIGHRYPASDIPEPARKLYLKNWLRLIPDVEVQAAPLWPPLDPTAEPLDMTHSRLRAVSPIHIEYLKNMGVSGSLSLSVIIKDELWGLIACHHYNGPQHLSFEVQRALTLMAQCFSMTLSALLSRKAYENRLKMENLLVRLREKIKGVAPLEKLVPRIAKQLTELVGANGMAMVGRQGVFLFGLTPDPDTVTRLAKWVGKKCQGEVFSHVSLGEEFPGYEIDRTAAGIMALEMGGVNKATLIWFRPELIVEELWGGDPLKPYSLNPETGKIHPRTSFETYRKTVKGTSRPWSEHEIFAASSLLPLFNAHIVRITESLIRKKEKALKEKNALLEAISMTDALTGVLNRRSLFKKIDAEIRRCKRYKTHLSISMLDVDHFKAVNDNYGHQTGDFVLKAVAAKLLQEARETDVVGRYGGEEFLILMPETSAENAVTMAERMRLAIERMNIDLINGNITVSIGVSSYSGEEISDFVASADARLYEAKKGGRNRVVASQ